MPETLLSMTQVVKKITFWCPDTLTQPRYLNTFTPMTDTEYSTSHMITLDSM